VRAECQWVQAELCVVSPSLDRLVDHKRGVDVICGVCRSVDDRDQRSEELVGLRWTRVDLTRHRRHKNERRRKLLYVTMNTDDHVQALTIHLLLAQFFSPMRFPDFLIFVKRFPQIHFSQIGKFDQAISGANLYWIDFTCEPGQFE
jgi:hypothetical protein